MSLEAILIEAVALADEILERGSQDGRGVRLAGLVLRLNESMANGNVPLSWRPTVVPETPVREPTASRPSWEQQVVDSIPDPEELDREWEHLCIPAPPKIPSSFPKSQISFVELNENKSK